MPGRHFLVSHLDLAGYEMASLPSGKRNFVVSYAPKAWIPGAAALFIAEPHTYYLLERHKLLGRFRDIRVASFLRSAPDDMRSDRDFVLAKYDRYLDVLAGRLNHIHGTNHSKTFWKRALSVGLTRHIALLYEFFKVCEHWFDPRQHVCNVLSPQCSYVPLDYDDHRWLLQHSAYGQEQIFSEYVNLFHPGMYPSYEDVYASPYRVPEGKYFTSNQPKVGIMRALVSEPHLRELVSVSHGEINSIGFDTIFNLYDGRMGREARTYLSSAAPDGDRFDRFFFASLRCLMPKVFVEYFHEVHDRIAGQLQHYNRLRYVLSEFWLGQTYEALALAILHNRGVKTIYHEHNYCEHAPLANFHNHFASFVDIFAAHGDYETEMPTSNLVHAGSLFEFTVPPEPAKKHKILHVSVKPGANLCYHTHASEEKENALRHFDFTRAYFSRLSRETIAQIHYRGYPSDNWSRCCTLFYDDLAFVEQFLHGATFDDLKKSNKQVMTESELVVVEYVSTSHLESMSMDIPTVVFFRPDSWALNSANQHMFEELIEVGIAQTHPVKAAAFVEQIKDEPQTWWRRPEVQSAKDRFLARNLGSPTRMKEYLLGLAGEASPYQSREKVDHE